MEPAGPRVSSRTAGCDHGQPTRGSWTLAPAPSGRRDPRRPFEGHYDQAVRFYRDLVGLPLLQSFAASYGEDGTIFGLSDTAVQLEIVRSVAPAVRADRVDMLVLTPARGVPEQYCASAQ